jgi:hypothetical protein
VVKRGLPEQVVPALLRSGKIERITWNRDYGPYAQRRDAAVRRAAGALGAVVEEHKDRVVFESSEVRTRSGAPFQVYTPFRNAWWARWHAERPGQAGPLRLPPPVATAHGDTLPGASAFGVGSDATDLPTAARTPPRAGSSVFSPVRSPAACAIAIAPTSTAPRGSRRICFGAIPSDLRAPRSSCCAEPRNRDPALVDRRADLARVPRDLSEHPRV